MERKTATTNEELKEKYFQEKLIEFRTNCSDGDYDSCFSLGEWYQVVARNFKNASEVYETNCFENNHPNSCYHLGKLYFSTNAKTENFVSVSKETQLTSLSTNRERARFLFKRGCELNQKESCTAYSTLVLNKIGTEKSLDKEQVLSSLNLLDRSCKGNDARACLKAASVLLQPKKEFLIERDPSRAFGFASRGCDLQSANCCQLLAVMYKRGDGVEKDEEMFKYYKKMTEELVRETGERMGVNSL
eukprot:maker-scaffold_4-snap-gene-10.53-mRNA-1 protein AED:0.00 eAED:0.00 QI:97/1/1/1/1/1/2/462/245